MAKKFLTALKLVNLSTDPESGSSGEIYYNSSDNAIKFYNGSSWLLINQSNVIVDSGNSYPVSPLNGQLFYNTSTGKTAIFYGNVWKEFAYDTDISGVDGGTPETSFFSSIIDGGSPSSTQFIDNYDGGTP